MFPRHRLLFASMLLDAGTGSASATPDRSPAEKHAERYQVLDQASKERWRAYIAESAESFSERR